MEATVTLPLQVYEQLKRDAQRAAQKPDADIAQIKDALYAAIVENNLPMPADPIAAVRMLAISLQQETAWKNTAQADLHKIRQTLQQVFSDPASNTRLAGLAVERILMLEQQRNNALEEVKALEMRLRVKSDNVDLVSIEQTLAGAGYDNVAQPLRNRLLSMVHDFTAVSKALSDTLDCMDTAVQWLESRPQSCIEDLADTAARAREVLHGG